MSVGGDEFFVSVHGVSLQRGMAKALQKRQHARGLATRRRRMRHKTAQASSRPVRSASLRRHDPYRFEGTLSATPGSTWHPQRERPSYWNCRSLARILMFTVHAQLRAQGDFHVTASGLRQRLEESLAALENWGRLLLACSARLIDKVIPAAAKAGWRPHGDSNPGTYRERVVSWASRRWGPGKISLDVLVEVRGIEPRTSCMPCKRSPS
jgi:hypothetical protein